MNTILDEPSMDEVCDRLCAAIEKLSMAAPVVHVSPPAVSVSAPNVSVSPNVSTPPPPTKWTFKIMRDPVTQRITEIIANGR